MSVSTAKRLPSLIRPMAMPATWAFNGTPASISASEPPQTELVRENLGVPLEGDRDVGALCGSHQGCQVPFRPPRPNVGLLLRHCSGKGLHLAMTGEPRGFSRVAAGFSSYDGEFRMPLV